MSEEWVARTKGMRGGERAPHDRQTLREAKTTSLHFGQIQSPGFTCRAQRHKPSRPYPPKRAERAQSRCRCGSGEPSPGADVAAVSPVPVQMWQR